MEKTITLHGLGARPAGFAANGHEITLNADSGEVRLTLHTFERDSDRKASFKPNGSLADLMETLAEAAAELAQQAPETDPNEAEYWRDVLKALREER